MISFYMYILVNFFYKNKGRIVNKKYDFLEF